MTQLKIKHGKVVVSLKVKAKDINTLKKIITKSILHKNHIGYNE